MDRSHTARLTERLIARFPGETLFDRVARTLCRAGCLPRKELYESWEMAKRIRRHFRGGRIADLAAGHGLLARLLLLLDDTSPGAVAVDARLPPCAEKVARRLEEEWPRLAGRATNVQGSIDEASLPVELGPDSLVVSAHACGALTDRVLDLAITARARVAVLPCCHTFTASERHAGFGGWVDTPLAIDLARAARLQREGYEIRTLTIPEDISPKNRLLLGEPRQPAPAGQ